MQENSSFESPLRVLVTGTPLFLRRYDHIFEALGPSFRLTYLPVAPVPHVRRAVYKLGSVLHRRAPKALTAAIEQIGAIHPWDARVFISRSLELESQIARLPNAPDLIIHVFSMYCPTWERISIPYVMILDYTEVLAYRNWRDWAPFVTQASLSSRLDCEKRAYERAAHLFPFGKGTQQSLIEDYCIDPAKITRIGCSARFAGYGGDKALGSKRILFYGGNGSEFYRKGGDLVLAAFRIVRRAIPDAKLAIVGMSSRAADPGVENYGFVSSADTMRELFLSSDVVLAPARCDSFPVFEIEAMNMGVPCITSDVDGIPEIVDHEVTGIVISNVTSQSLAAETMRLLNDPKKLAAMSRTGKEKAREKFSSARVARIMAEAIHKLPLRPNGGGGTAIHMAPRATQSQDRACDSNVV